MLDPLTCSAGTFEISEYHARVLESTLRHVNGFGDEFLPVSNFLISVSSAHLVPSELFPIYTLTAPGSLSL